MRVLSMQGALVSRRWVQRGMAFVCSAVLAVFALLVLSGKSAYAVATPAWDVSVASVPSVLPVGLGRDGRFVVIVENTGGSASEGGAMLHDVLPPGLSAREAGAFGCTGEGTGEVECPLPEGIPVGGLIAVYVEFEETGSVAPGSSLRNVASVSGGGGVEVAREVSIRARREGEAGPGPGGIASFMVGVTGPSGEPLSQAGGHPDLLTTAVFFNSQFAENVSAPAKPAESVKDLVFYLPLGMLGNPLVAQRCQVSLVEPRSELTGCPPSSRIGTVMPLVLSAPFALEHGIYNITPEKGFAAEFAFSSNSLTFVSYANVVRRHGTYMVRVSTPGIPASTGLLGFVASFYGDIKEQFETHEIPASFDRGAFLTDPTDCEEGPQAREASVAMDTWEHPNPELPNRASSVVFPSLTGCDLLNFAAALHVRPETTQADEPTGIEAGLEVPQTTNDATALGTPPAKDVVVKLPEGVTVSPSSANGLQACAQTGPHGINIDGAEAEEIAADGLARPAPGHCSPASQIGTVRASTPLLNEEVTGRMFLAQPECGAEGQPACTSEDAEDGKLVGLYLELQDPNAGIVVKLRGHASIAGGSGRVTASFEEIPQFPISNVVVTTKQGARAPLANPQVCGQSFSSATVTPWSPGTPVATPSASYDVDWGAGAPCPAAAPFAPSFTAGTTNPLAASTSPFTLTLKREDREQNINTVSTTLPEGLLADLSKVVRCPEPQASENSLTACPAASQIGTTTVAVGSGSDPYYVTGKVFFTGPYAGAPFGLSVVVPAVAGPFNLGNVHVRVKLFVDPRTARASAVSDPLPQQLDGIPLRMRVINLNLTDGEFVLNPTSCSKMSIVGTVTSTTGGSAPISSPFAAEGCKNLPFKPTFSAFTKAKATKANGTSVRVKIGYSSGGQANIAKVVVGFPKQLPVRLETLQKACRAVVFEANPAACPTAANVGTATARTPILAKLLTGPIYLVSYGNAKFPTIVLVLQGEGLTIEVDGQSFVSKSGALKATFAAVPDAPINSIETVLPAGRYSQFTSVKTSGKAKGRQCGEKLAMPVTMVAHNGKRLTENVSMKVTGCRPSVVRRHKKTGPGRRKVKG